MTTYAMVDAARRVEARIVRVRASSRVRSHCWRFTGARTSDGYAIVKVRGSRVPQYAHRIMYAVHVGRLRDREIDHLCGVRDCVRPDHLRATSRAAHMRRHMRLRRLEAAA